jgi:hypothetical protein
MTEQIVAVRYRDIGCDQTEMYTADELLHRKGVEFVIFGMLRVDTPEKVVIAQELCENGNYRGATTILRPLVVEVLPIGQWPLKRKRPKRPPKAAAVEAETSVGTAARPARVLELVPQPIAVPSAASTSDRKDG